MTTTLSPETSSAAPIGYQLPDELRMLQAVVRDFIQNEIIPREASLDSDAPFLRPDQLAEVQAKARKLGLWYLGAPAEYGGAGLSMFALTVVAEESSQHRLGAYNPAAGAFGWDLPNPIFKGTREQIERYAVPSIRDGLDAFIAITEPSGGSDPARSIQTKAVRSGNKWILNGTKIFISEVDISPWGIVFARTDASKGRAGITSFIIERDWPGVKWSYVPVIRPWYPAELSFQDVEIPVENQLGEEGQGFAFAEHWLTSNRIPYAAAVIGISCAALRMATKYANERVAFKTPLAEKQAVQWMIADSEVELRAARWLTWEAAWKADRGEPFKFEASVAKLFATETAGRVIDRCIQIFGGMGVSKELPLERWFRELRIKRIGEGPSEVHRMVIARDLLSGRR